MNVHVDVVDAGGGAARDAVEVVEGGQVPAGPLAETIRSRMAGRPEGAGLAHSGDSRPVDPGLLERTHGPAQPLSNNLERTTQGPPIR